MENEKRSNVSNAVGDVEQPGFTRSILLTIKKMLGISEEYHAFDIDIATHINSVFLSLNQLDIGGEKPFTIYGPDETWEDAFGDELSYLNGIESYVYFKVRLAFDPPTNSFLTASIEKQIAELEWRMMVQAEKFKNEDDEVPEEPPANPEEPTNPDENPDHEPGTEVDDDNVSSESESTKFSSRKRPKTIMELFS